MTEVDGKLLPVNILGDIWLDIGINNLHNEGGIEFRNGKKPEKAIHRIIEMATNPNDWVLDSFLGSGTTAAVAHKMKRKWIGIELGEHATTHSIPRLQKVITGEDTGGVSKVLEWKGGGGFKFYTLAPSLIQKDKYGNDIINPEYNANMLAAAMAKQEGFRYLPHESIYWKQGNSSERDFIFTTTQFITVEMIDRLSEEMQPNESLLICCKGFKAECKSRHSNITIKKIPQMLYGRCEFGKDDYSFNIVNLPHDEEEKDAIEEAEISIEETTGKKSKFKAKKKRDEDFQSSLF
ncbi:MAG: site-specific DNA-methyltransferase [Bacteroidota bacterium]